MYIIAIMYEYRSCMKTPLLRHQPATLPSALAAEQLLRWREAPGALGLSEEVTFAPKPGQNGVISGP